MTIAPCVVQITSFMGLIFDTKDVLSRDFHVEVPPATKVMYFLIPRPKVRVGASLLFWGGQAPPCPSSRRQQRNPGGFKSGVLGDAKPTLSDDIFRVEHCEWPQALGDILIRGVVYE